MKLFQRLLYTVFRASMLWLFMSFVRETAETAAGCDGEVEAADVIFLLDSSYSVWRSDFRRQLTFVQEVIEMLPIGPNAIRVAIVTYADYPQLQFHLDQYSTKSDLRVAVEEIRQRGGFQTINADAIRFVRRNVFEVGLRSRPLKAKVARVAVVVTDGRSDNRTSTVIEAELAKQEGIRMILVGVGKDVDLEELKETASLPSDHYTFLIDNFAGLAGIRDLVATQTCKVAESSRSIDGVFANHATAATMMNTKSVSTETSATDPSVSNEIPARSPNISNASLSKAILKTTRHPSTSINKTIAAVTTTLRGLISSGIDSITALATKTSLPIRAPNPKSSFTGPVSSRSASTATVSDGAVTSSASSITTQKTTVSVSLRKLFPQTDVLPTGSVNLPPSSGITGAEGFWKVEDLQRPSNESQMRTATRDAREEADTAINEEPTTVFLTRTSEVVDKVIANASDFKPTKDSTAIPHKTSSGVETSFGFGLLDRILNGTISSEARKRDGETEDVRHRKEEDQKPADTGIQRIHTAGEVEKRDQKLSSHSSLDTQASTPETVTQVTDGRNDAGTKKTVLETTSSKSTRRGHATDGRTTAESIRGPQERKSSISASRDNNWGSVEPSLPSSNRETTAPDDGDKGHRREEIGRSDSEPGYPAGDYWRLTDGGTLIRYRMIRPGVYERETKASNRTPPLQANPRRRVVISRSDSIHSPTFDDHKGQDKSYLRRKSTDGEGRANVSRAANGRLPIYRSRLISRTQGIRDGYLRGSNTPDERRVNRERSHTHRPQANSSGFWRLNDDDKLVWKGNPQSGHTTGTSDITFSRAHANQSSMTPGVSQTHNHLEVDATDSFISNSGAQPRLTADIPTAQKASPVNKVSDVTEGVSDQMTPTTKRPGHSGGAAIDDHNPKHGFWKYDRSGRSSIWVSYTSSDDKSTSTDRRTTDVQSTTRASGTSTSGTRGPSVVDSDDLSYGYWTRENGKSVWHEYQSPGVYRRVVDTDHRAVPNKIRIELPPGKVLGCQSCNVTGSALLNYHAKVNQSSSVKEVADFRENDRLNRTRSVPLGPAVRIKDGRDSRKGNRTLENIESTWKGENNEMDMKKRRTQRRNVTIGIKQFLKENHRTSSTSNILNSRRGGVDKGAKTTNSVLNPSPDRRKLEPGNLSRAVGTDSVHRKGTLIRKNPPAAKNQRKPGKGCVPRHPLDVVFVVDPRARERPYTRHLWQLAYEVVSQVRMDDDRVRVRFYPELEVVKPVTAAIDGSTEYGGNVERVVQMVAQKPVAELLRAASRMLTQTKQGVRRIGVYLTDGPSGSPLELERAAEEVREEAAGGIEMFSVGIGQETDPAELESIADSRITGKHMYRLGRPLKPDIDAVAMKLRRALCGGR